MLQTAASRAWKAKDAIEWFHGIGRLERRSALHRKWGMGIRHQDRVRKGGLNFVSFLHDTSEKGFLRAFAVPLEYASVRLFVCSPNAFTSD
jgi:hypothetical protein